MSGDDRLVSRLLAGRDQLSRIEKDAILEQTLAEVTPRPRPRARWLWLAVPALAASVVLLVVAPWHSTAPAELTARGSARPIAALRVTCSGGCTRGAKLLFDLHGTTSYRYFAAFAKRADGTVLWYFPGPEEPTSVDLAALPASGVLSRGIVLGDEHPAGTYRIYGVFSHAPLTRAAIRDAFDPAHLTSGPDTELVTVDVEVR